MSASKAACLVLHGRAAMREDVRSAVHAVRGQGWRVDVCVTWEGGDATRFTREARDAGYDVVVAGGGDGTVSEVVAGLLGDSGPEGTRVSLGILPLGTGNDLATACGIPHDPLSALNLAVHEPARMVDVGRANERWFLNMASGGFGARVTTATSEGLKRTLGRMAYLLTGLTMFTEIRPARGRLSGPGLDWEGLFLVVAVGNGRQAGGGRRLCPEALLDDGFLDVRLLPGLPREDFEEVFGAILREGLGAVRRAQVTARVTWVEIETDEPMQINLDGEPMEGSRFRFEVVERVLQAKLPRGCLLLRDAAPANEPGGPRR